MSKVPIDLLDEHTLQARSMVILAQGSSAESLQAYRQLCRDYLRQGWMRIETAYRQGASGLRLVRGQSRLTDGLLKQIWQALPTLLDMPAPTNAALVAVGGYGRNELHPHSDIDLLFLFGHQPPDSAALTFVERLVGFLWDIRLEIGHSVRTLDECVSGASEDITIATSLLEARFLAGNFAHFQSLQDVMREHNPWSAVAFFEAKLAEQRVRHARFGDTAYNLEPNVKEGPGALRDLHVVDWVAKRYFGCQDLRCLIQAGFVTDPEYRALIQARNFLWRLRSGLHYAAHRREDRLLFDYQYLLASDLGYQDTAESLAVEKLMKRYFRTLKEVSLITGMLLQTLGDEILPAPRKKRVPLDAHFELGKGQLRAIQLDVFSREPESILRLFEHLQKAPDQVRIGPKTLRALRASLPAINRQFRENPANQAAFMRILRSPRGVIRALRQMNAYGVLGAYIPSFGRIVGQMQHDLFHVYTVDQHTLFLVRNLRRFAVKAFQAELPLCTHLYQNLKKPERLLIAGLFHDIAKGRGGDHSALGAADVRRFCRAHGLPREDIALVEWLVRSHLLMSSISQRRDISDPDVISEFVRVVGTQERLDHLLLLTVADIRATNPSLWNSWKAQLLWDLYHATSKALSQDKGETPLSDDIIRSKQSDVLGLLPAQNSDLAHRHWERLRSAYFFRYNSTEIAWHTQAIIDSHSLDLPLVKARLHPQQSSTELLIYAPNLDGLFAHLTGALDRLGLNIVDARLDVTPDGFALDTFRVLDGDEGCIDEPQALREFEKSIRASLLGKPLKQAPSWRIRRRRRRSKAFSVDVNVHFNNSALDACTLMEIVAPDRPGLLHQIACVLQSTHVQIQGAKVATFGERAEDTFFLVDKNGDKLDETTLHFVRTRLLNELSGSDAASA